MTYRDGKWVVDAQPPEEPRRRKKRFVTPAMKSANKRNSQLAAGKKSAAGRERSSMNATVHAMTCTKLVFLPGESPEQFEAEVMVWARRVGAKTEPEIAQVRTAVYCELKALRAENGNAHAVTREINRINDQFANEKAQETWALIPRLAARPKETFQSLMNSTYGCTWLIDQLTLISEWLLTHPSLEVSMRAFTLSLGGHDVKDLFTDPFVMEFNRAYLAGIVGDDGFTVAALANAVMKDRPDGMSYAELERLMLRHTIDRPTPAQGQAFLEKFVDDQIAIIGKWRKLIELREERDKATAIGEAQSDITTAGSKRDAYAARSKRLHFAALRMCFALQQERRKYGEGDLSDLDPAVGQAAAVAAEPLAMPETVAEGAESGEDRAVEKEKKNEPVVSQVVGGDGGCNEPEESPGVDPVDSFEFSAEEIAAAVKLARQRTEELLREG